MGKMDGDVQKSINAAISQRATSMLAAMAEKLD